MRRIGSLTSANNENSSLWQKTIHDISIGTWPGREIGENVVENAIEPLTGGVIGKIVEIRNARPTVSGH
jgi:protoporphyrinogen oxidase